MQTTVLDSFAIIDNKGIINSKNKLMSLKVTKDCPKLETKVLRVGQPQLEPKSAQLWLSGQFLQNASFKGLEMDSEKTLLSAPRCSMGQIQPPKGV